LPDIDECAADMDDCHAQAVCMDIDGGYICTCNTGYTGDGQVCSGKYTSTKGFQQRCQWYEKS